MTARDTLLGHLTGASWPHAPLLSALDLAPSARVLDIGGGQGNLPQYLQEQGHTGDLIGLEPIPTGRPAGVQLMQGDADALPFPDASFDAVLLIRVLAHLHGPVLALREAARILRRRGQLIVACQAGRHLTRLWAAVGAEAAEEGPEVQQREWLNQAGLGFTEQAISCGVTFPNSERARELVATSGQAPELNAEFPLQDTLELAVLVCVRQARTTKF